MNIKSIANQIFSFPVREKDRTRTETNPEREAHAQYEGRGEQTPNRHMTDEEVAKVVENLKALKGVQENNLNVRVENSGGTLRIFVETTDGKVVRRISEKDLWSVLKSEGRPTGNLLDKAT